MSDLMARAWTEWLERERSNVETLEERLRNLSSNHESPAGFQYSKFWAEVNEIADLFNTLTPLPGHEKERLWDWYYSICEKIRKRQAEELKARKAQSTQKRQLIEGRIQEAYSCAESAPEDMETLSRAQLLLKEALSFLKNDGKVFSGVARHEGAEADSLVLMRRDRQACWDKWREVNDEVHAHRQAIWDTNYRQIDSEARAALEGANGRNPYEALEMVKAAQSRLKQLALSKEQREDVKSILNSAWDTAIARVNEIREQRRRKREEWLNQKQSEIQDYQNQLQKNEEASSDLQDEIEKLREAIQGSRSREYGDKLRTQIAEKRRKIREIKRTNRELEEKIEFAKSRL